MGVAAVAPLATLVTATPAVAAPGDVNRLRDKLQESPAERKAFLADPKGYAERLGLRSISEMDISGLRKQLADGFCCNGCGCSGRDKQ
jgi:hypothetical protein